MRDNRLYQEPDSWWILRDVGSSFPPHSGDSRSPLLIPRRIRTPPEPHLTSGVLFNVFPAFARLSEVVPPNARTVCADLRADVERCSSTTGRDQPDLRRRR